MLNVERQGAELVLGSTLAAGGAAVREVTRATEEMHHKYVWPQRLAHDEVLTVNCRRVNCYSNPVVNLLLLLMLLQR